MVDIKETIKAMCKAYPGGKSAMAGALGMTLTEFNNNLYEKNGCRFFEIDELEAMEDLSGTSLLAEYFAQRRGALLVDVPKFDDLDQVELYSRSVYTAARRGKVDQMIKEAIEDGVIDEHEAKEISFHHARHLAAREAEIRCMLALFGRRKGKRS
ncbi:YmfL family putative regulatory protein [Brenneria populi subsp. brevivirga]|uniref:YmfL family putative regulatory protein n=1 Tax=Brenneria populi TaxID=1505588 RepID=UPI002E1810A1|nr:YmfL family putative regulatory protein [Brenneria populi subsp. brevivirga]